jgi:4-hydroxybenzoate polyprenyltransferase
MTALGIDTEIMLMFLTAVFFTVLFLIAKEKGFQLFFGALTTVSWMILGVVFVASQATFTPIGLLFTAIGLCFIGFDIYLAFHKPEQTDIEGQ